MSEIKIESISKLELGPNDILVVRLHTESVLHMPPDARVKYVKFAKDAIRGVLDAAGLRNQALFVIGDSTQFGRLVGISQPATPTPEESVL